MATVVGPVVESATSQTTHTFTVPSGVTAGMACLFTIGTGSSTAVTMTMSATGASFVKLDERNATNTRIGVFTGTGLVAGQTVTLTLSATAIVNIGQLYTSDYSFAGSLDAPAVRATSVATTAIGPVTPANGQRVFVIGIERSTGATTLSSVSSSGGETVTQDVYGEGTGQVVSIYLGHFDASAASARTVTLTYSQGTLNAYGALLRTTAVVAGAPAAPTGMTARTTNGGSVGSIVMSWNSATMAAGDYDTLYETASPGGVSGADQLTTRTTTRTPGSSRTYDYWTTATRGGIEGPASAVVHPVLPWNGTDVVYGGGADTGGSGGTTVVTGTPSTPGEALWIGSAAGRNKFNVGIAMSTTTHTDYSATTISDGLTNQYFLLSTDKMWVRFIARIDGATTSSGTKYARSELRELTESLANMSFNASSGTHRMKHVSKVMHLPPNKSSVCFTQVHNGGSDLARVQTEGSDGDLKIVMRNTPPGGTEIVRTILSTYTLGQELDCSWSIVNGVGTFTLNGTSWTFDADISGCYYKCGAYAQTNETIDDASETCEVWIKAGSLQAWHTGQATPTTPSWQTTAVIGAVGAGADVTVAAGSAVNRTATETGQVLSREWRITSGPSSVGTVLSTTSALAWVAPASTGTYVLTYTGTYAGGATATDTMNVIVTAAAGGGTTSTGVITERTATLRQTSSAASLPADMTNAQVGDFAIITATSAATAFDDPPAWERLVPPVTFNGNAFGAWYRLLTGDVEDSPTIVAANGETGVFSVITQAWGGVHPTVPLDVAPSAITAAPTGTAGLAVPSISTVTPGAIVTSGVAIDATTSTYLLTPPSFLTARQQTTGVGRRAAVASARDDSIGATGAAVWTHGGPSSLTMTGYLAALRPAPASGTGTVAVGPVTDAARLTESAAVVKGALVVPLAGVDTATLSESVSTARTDPAGIADTAALHEGAQVAAIGGVSVIVRPQPVTVTKIVDTASVRVLVRPGPAYRGTVFPDPVRLVVTAQPVTVGRSGEPATQTHGLPPVWTPKPYRLIAQKILSGEWISWELPVSDPSIEWRLSGTTTISGTFKPEIRELADLGLEPWGTWIHLEEDGVIRGSAIMTPSTVQRDGTLSLDAVGPHGYVSRIPFRDRLALVGVDPADVVRMLWAHAQSFPRGALGVTVIGSTPITIGTEARDVEFVTGEGEQVSFTAGPYALDYWNNTIIGTEIESLAKDTPFDFTEWAGWTDATRTKVAHAIYLDYPLRGVRRTDLRFADDENITEAAPIEEPGDAYADTIYVQGKGEGIDQIAGSASAWVGERLRLPAIVDDKSIDSLQRANSVAGEELAARLAALIEIPEIVVAANHPNAPLGSFAPGDEIRPIVTYPYTGTVRAWHRITAVRYLPLTGRAVLGLTREGEYRGG